MDVFFEPQGGSPFSVEVGYFDTVSEIKEKIEKYQRIPVSRQTLIFNGRVLQDDRDVEQCQILHNSRIRLFISPSVQHHDHRRHNNHNHNHNNHNSNPNHHHQVFKIEQPLSSDRISNLRKEANDAVSRKEPHLPGMFQTNGQDLAAGKGGNPKKLRLMVLPKCGTRKIPVEVNAADNVGELRKELAKIHQRLQISLPQEGYFFIYKQNVMDDDRSFRWHHVDQGDTIEIFNGSVSGGS